MYDFLEGRIASCSPGAVVVQVNGVGYHLHVPVPTSQRLAEGDAARLYTHLYVREENIRLYGFLRPQEREVFRRLHSVSSVGPEKALSLLSALSLEQLCRAVSAGDATALTRVRGIGKKTAERIILELRDELAEWAAGDGAPGWGAASEAAAGMEALGYRKAEALAAVQKALAALGEGASVEDLIREALRHV